MKKDLLLFLLPLKLIAQEIPISESNYFVYVKYNVSPLAFGGDFYTLAKQIYRKLLKI